MKTVAVIMQKGGVGKTTIARSLAVAGVQAGYRTMLIDMDQQQSAVIWGKLRKAAEPAIVFAVEQDLEGKLADAEAAGYQLAIIDTPPARSSEAVIAAEVADLVVAPIQPSPDAYAQIQRTARVVRVAEAASLAVPSMIHPASKQDAVQARDFAANYGLAPCDAQLTMLKTHQHAALSGQVAGEIEPDGRAAMDVQAVFMAVCAQLGLCKPGQPNKRTTA